MTNDLDIKELFEILSDMRRMMRESLAIQQADFDWSHGEIYRPRLLLNGRIRSNSGKEYHV